MTNDEIREKILESLYEKHQTARSRATQICGIRDLARVVKTKITNIKENEVASNVDFLVQNKYIEEVTVENFFAKSKFGNSKPSYKYRLGREGLAYFEHGSKFDTASVFAGRGGVNRTLVLSFGEIGPATERRPFVY